MFPRGVGHALVTSPTSFPLSKFSYATVSGELVKPIPWRHVSDKGHLFAVFTSTTPAQESIPSVPGKILFKVLSGPEIMEDLDLRALGQQATVAAEEMRTLPSPPHFPKVTIIIQEPCIAVRFPLSYGQIRRFQMKFQNSIDFYNALALFSQSGCPFTQAGQTSRPFTAPSSVDLRDDSIQPRVQNLPPTTAQDQRVSVASEYPYKHISRQEYANISPRIQAGHNSQNDESTVVGPRNMIKSRGLNPESGAGQHTFSIQNDNNGLGLSMSSRPVTAPTTGIPDKLAGMLPPRRELPFKRPGAPVEGDLDTASGQRSNVKSTTLPRVDLYGAHSYGDAREEENEKASSETIPRKLTAKRGNTKGRAATRVPSRAAPCKRPHGTSPKSRKSLKIDVLADTDTETPHETQVREQVLTSNEVATRSRGHAEISTTNVSIGSMDGFRATDSRNRALATEEREKRLVERNRRKQEQSEEPQAERGGDIAHSGQRILGSSKDGNLRRERLEETKKVIQKETVELSAAPPTRNKPPQAKKAGQDPVGRMSSPAGGMPSDCSADKENSNPVAGEASIRDPDNLPHSERRRLGLHSIIGLLNDPKFFQSSDLTQWADLPAGEKKEVLEKWMCEQLDNPGFAELVKTVDGMWQRMLLG